MTLTRRSASPTTTQPGPSYTRWVALALILVTAAVFAPALFNGFVDWDDEKNLVRNTNFRGFSWTHVRWILTNTLMGHYIPVTWTSFALDHALWGMNPLGYHLTNVVLHSLNAALVFLGVLRLLAHATAWTPPTLRLAAGTAALFFALHPLRAESVAWATERRDVLSGFFFLLCVLGYLAAQERAGRARYVRLAGSVVAFALALLSKSIVMGLPLILVVLDVYPLRRLSLRSLRVDAESRRALIEKIPYVLLGIGGAAIAYWAVRSNDFLTPMEAYPWPARIAMAAYSFWFYVSTTAVPLGLSPLYELPASVSPFAPQFLGPIVAVGATTAIAVIMRRRWPALLAVWACYLLMLAPVSGIVHAGYQLAHDRYSYLSCLGWAVLVGAALAALRELGRAGHIRPLVTALGTSVVGVWLLGFATLTWHQVQVWKDSDALWTYAVDQDPTCAICHSNLGILLVNQDNPVAGIPHIERALTLRPDRVRTRANLAVALLKINRRQEALAHFGAVLKWYPKDVDILSAMGVTLMQDGRAEEALTHLRRAVAIDPKNVLARSNHATALAHAGQRAAALEEYQAAIALDPYSTAARYGLGWALARFGDREGARAQVEVLSKMDATIATRLVREIDAGL